MKLDALSLPPVLKVGLKAAAASMTDGSAGASRDAGNSMSSIVRIDVSRGGKHVVTFVNNLEKDAAYKRWSRSLRMLNMPSWSLHTISRNLYTLIAVIDPLSLDGAALSMQMNMMWQQQFPVRFGVVLMCNGPSSSSNPRNEKGERVFVLFIVFPF